MENEKVFKTLIGETWTSNYEKTVKINEFVKGKILGVLLGVSNGNAKIYRLITDSKSGMITFNAICTRNQYESFAKIIEKNYPELCKFDIDEVAQ